MRSDGVTSMNRRVCDGCSVRRVKCDGRTPCAACSKSSMECTRLRVKRKSGPKGVRRKTLDQLKLVKQRNANATDYPRSADTSGEINGSPAQHECSSHAQEQDPDPLEFNLATSNFQDNAMHDRISLPLPQADTSRVEAWPFHILPSTLEPYLDIYHYKFFPVWPIVDKDVIMARLCADEPDANAYMLASSVVAATMLQLQLSVYGADSGVLEPSSMLAEVENLRRTYDYRENASFDHLSTSFFMHVAYLHCGRRMTSTFLLREAITLAHMLDLHKPSHYQEVEETESQYQLRVFWLLFITERAHCAQHDIPCIMIIDPDMPELDSENQPFILSAFTMLCKMFRSYSEASAGNNFTADSLTSLNNQLIRIPAASEYHNDLQRVDLSVTQQWLRLMFWKLAISQVMMTANPRDDIRSIFFPIHIAKDLLSQTCGLSMDAFEAHGPGMELKLFEVTNSVADMVTCLPPHATSGLEFGPQDYLVHLAQIISKFRGGNRTLLPLLQSRLATIGLDSAIVPRILDVTYDSPDSQREKSSIESNEAFFDGYTDERVDNAAWPEALNDQPLGTESLFKPAIDG